VPQSKQNDNFSLSRNNFLGVMLRRAQDLSSQVFKEPPPGKLFNNCTGTAKVALEPGTSKSGTVYHTFRGYFNNVICQKLKSRMLYVGGVTGGLVEHAPGKMEMFALEERLNSGSLNLITVQYESELTVGVILTTGKSPVCLASHQEATFSNV